MGRYLLSRILAAITLLLGISIFIFLMIRLIPGDTVDMLLGTQFALTPEQERSLRELFGIDKPLLEQYVRWAARIFTGDLGYSVRTGEPVLDALKSRFPVTAELTGLALVLAVCGGTIAGVASGLRSNTAVDSGIRLIGLLGLSIPHFWLGTLLLLLLSRTLRWIPDTGALASLTSDPLRNLLQMALPAISLAAGMAAAIMRMARSSLLEVLRQDFVRTARGKGLSETVVVVKHSLRNALIPIITLVGIQTGYLLGGTVIVEEVFALPGIGRLTLHAVYQRDYALVQAAVLLMAANFIVLNIGTDLLYAAIDPRIRYSAE